MADFQIAVNLTLKNEGGFQNSPNDRGNWTGGQIGVGELKGTKYGISAMAFPALDIENLTIEQAEAIYKQGYWNVLYDDIKDQFIANKLFDMSVNEGIGEAVKLLQQILQPHFPNITVDGHFGPITLAAINASDPISLLAAYKTVLVARALQIGADNPTERPFVSDWIKRINS